MHDVGFGSRPDGYPYIVEAGANWVIFWCTVRRVFSRLTGIRCKERSVMVALRTRFTLW